MAVAGDNCFVQYRRTQVSGVRLSYIAVTVRTLIPLFSFLFLFVSPAGMDATMVYLLGQGDACRHHFLSSPPSTLPTFVSQFRHSHFSIVLI